MEDESKYSQYVSSNIQKDNNGTYKVKYRLRDLSGKVIKESSKMGFRTLREAKQYAEQLKHEHAETLYKAEHPAENMTFAELYEKYRVSRLGDKPSTVIGRESLINSRVLPFFGEMQIHDISTDTISQWHACFYNADGEAVLSDTYLRNLHSRLSAVLNYAVQCGWLEKKPARYCSIGEKNAAERPVWSPEEYSRFRKQNEDEPEAYYAFETLYFTGMRLGELLGLTLEDVDFRNRTIRINKSLQRLQGRNIVTSPKTKMSVRTVKINQGLADELREYLQSRPSASGKEQVFPIDKYYLSRKLERGTKMAELDPITIHCFRHSHITNLIAAGYSPVDIAKRVGHESIYITLHYSHAFKNVENDIADNLDRMMEGLN